MSNVVQIVINGLDKSDKAFLSAKSNLIAVEKLAKTAAIAMAVFAAAAAGAAILGAARLTKEAIDTADAMGRLAQQSGIAVDDFSRLSYAANLAEVDANQLKTATKALADEMVKAGRGNESVLETILATADAFADMEDGAAKTNRAVQLFGKAGQELIPLLNQGSEAIRAQMTEADRFGKTIGGDFARNADQFNDNLDRLKASFEGVWLRVADDVLPSLIELTETLIFLADNSGVVAASVDVISHSLYSYAAAARAALDPTKSLADVLTGDVAKGMADSLTKGIGSALRNALKAPKKSSGDLNPADEKALELQDKLQLMREEGGERLREQERLAHEKRLDEIKRLTVAEGISAELRTLAEITYQDRLTEIRLTGEEARAELDERMRRGDVERFIASLQATEGATLASLEGRQQFLQTYQALWMESHRTMFSYAAEASQKLYQGLSTALTNIITGAQSAEEAFKALGKQMVAMVVGFIAQRTVAFALEKTMAAVGLGILKTATIANTTAAAALAGSWGAAATAAAIATFGAATAAGAGVPALMAANAALGAGIATAAGGVSGVFHGGADYVPQTASYLLKEGEAVLQPEANTDLREFLANGRAIHVEINLDGRAIYKGMSEASRDGRLVIDAKSVI